jgi:hypothetical protein
MARCFAGSVVTGEFVSDLIAFACLISDSTSRDCGVFGISFPSRRIPNVDAEPPIRRPWTLVYAQTMSYCSPLAR